MPLPRALILMLTVIEAGWMSLDGVRALIVGSFVTPSSGPYAGQVGPWRVFAIGLGIAPNGRLMHWAFALYGLTWLAVALAFALHRPWAWAAMLMAAVC